MDAPVLTRVLDLLCCHATITAANGRISAALSSEDSNLLLTDVRTNKRGRLRAVSNTAVNEHLLRMAF